METASLSVFERRRVTGGLTYRTNIVEVYNDQLQDGIQIDGKECYTAQSYERPLVIYQQRRPGLRILVLRPLRLYCS